MWKATAWENTTELVRIISTDVLVSKPAARKRGEAVLTSAALAVKLPNLLTFPENTGSRSVFEPAGAWLFLLDGSMMLILISNSVFCPIASWAPFVLVR